MAQAPAESKRGLYPHLPSGKLLRMNASQTKRILLAILNLLGVVGIGTILAGRKWTGCLQVGLALIGLATTLAPMIWLHRKYSIWELAFGKCQSDPTLYPLGDVLAALVICLAGFFVFSLTWLWSGTTTGEKKAPELSD
jgi:hypothetical protein